MSGDCPLGQRIPSPAKAGAYREASRALTMDPGFRRGSGIGSNRAFRGSVGLFLFLLLAAPPARAAPPDLSALGVKPHPGAELPLQARFHDEHGKALRLADLFGAAPVILTLVYYHCPNLCGVVQDDLFHALSLSGLTTPADYRMVAISIDPKETSTDAADAKARDLARHPTIGADRGWHFLTGDADAIGAVARTIGYTARWDPKLKQFIHPTGLVFVSPTGRVSSYLLGVGYQPGDITTGVVRARNGGIARAILPVLLLCFHFDATTGRYTFEILRILGIMAALFAFSFAVLLGSWFTRARRRG